MAHLDIAPGEALYYEYDAPGAAGATFVFVNALTGNTGTWQHADIGPALRAAGYGTLAWNFRGQAQTRFGASTALTPKLVVEDLQRVVAHAKPPKPIVVGLSIGGLFAAQAVLAGMPAAALVLINTLRKPGARLEWINQATVALARAGGTRLVMEANLPQLVNPDQLAAMRAGVFSGEPYQPMDRADGLYRLLEGSLATDWNFPWDKLKLPVLSMTGLHDRVFRVAQDVDELSAKIAGLRRVEFADAGHLIPVERPAAFAKALLEFAKGI
ncbi:MAG: alpha/beta hydrolase [Betaproteobacteria bacterium]|nr:alpha/beta hydrolase [Betaproteobacteria bacterium]